MTADDRRQRGIDTMKQVYGFDIQDGPGDFFALTVDHLFADIWNRPGLTNRDRRLLLIGLLTGLGLDDVIGIQVDAALTTGDISPDELREIVIFLAHYAGWPWGAKLDNLVERMIARHQTKGQ